MLDENDRDDTDEVDPQQAILVELQNLVRETKDLNSRMERLEERVEQVVTDLNTIHQLQRTYTGRLATIEQMCVDKPLTTARPTPTPVSMAVSGGRLKP